MLAVSAGSRSGKRRSRTICGAPSSRSDRFNSSSCVAPFATEILEAGGFRFTGKHYRSRLDGKLVVIAETDPIKGRPSDAFLKQVADVADVLPPP
ncbi:hypothetical protein OHS58_10045 [Amycolatopsis sp. NBC_00348]|uniref:hypothetical protein n=1 Tax=Amycolatopsis sp. NBC_00348 TaxID=2975956 RepID=UPI002E25AB56